METVLLWRLVGENGLALIEESGFRRFPPRLDWQPIFLPGAERGLRHAPRLRLEHPGWRHRVRHLLRGRRRAIARYEPHEAGGRELRDYWIPAEDLEAFNGAARATVEETAL
jgi:hypothetical protein